MYRAENVEQHHMHWVRTLPSWSSQAVLTCDAPVTTTCFPCRAMLAIATTRVLVRTDRITGAVRPLAGVNGRLVGQEDDIAVAVLAQCPGV
jgi:hypothetical protein